MTLTLSPTPEDTSLLDIFGSSAWVVGGRLRDGIIAQQRGEEIVSKDADYLITGLPYEDILERLKNAGFRTDSVGASFAVIKATKNDLTLDIALPRFERSTGSGHKDFEVDFGPHVPIEDDLKRRDFTCNALAYNLASQTLFDPYNGQNDIERGILRTVSNTAMEEDPLRILRGMQFASRFGFALAPKTDVQIQHAKHSLSTVSEERIHEELEKLMMKSPKPSLGWNMLAERDLLQYTIPEFEPSRGCKQNTYHTLDVWDHCLLSLDTAVKEGGDSQLRWGAFLHDIGKPATARWEGDDYGNSFHGHESTGAEISVTLLRRLRFSTDESSVISSLVRHHMYATQVQDGSCLSPKAIRRFIHSVTSDGPTEPQERLRRQFFIRMCDVAGKGNDYTVTEGDHNDIFQKAVFEELTKVPPLSVRDLAISGKDVMNYFIDQQWEKPEYRGSATIGKVLKACLEDVLDTPEHNTKEHLSSIIHRVGTELYQPQNHTTESLLRR